MRAAPRELTVAPSKAVLSPPWLLFPAALVGALLSTNPGLTALAVVSAAVVVALLWRPGEPPALLFMCGMQWLQGAMPVLYCDVTETEVWTSTHARNIEEAIAYTLVWVMVLALGAWAAMRTLDPARIANIDGLPIRIGPLVAGYMGMTALIAGLGPLLPPQVQQLLVAFEAVRWALVFAVFVRMWTEPRLRLIALVLLAIEVGFGLLSFFSAFRMPLFVFLMALFATGYRPSVGQYFYAGLIGLATLFLAIVWSAVKMDYRAQLTGGVASQTVELGAEERAQALLDVTSDLDADLLEFGVQRLTDRLAYVEFFALTLDFVPAARPHEDGRLTAAAVSHVFMPRLLFPDKRALESDTSVTERYTGLNMSRTTGATSISIGLPAEAYVDWGLEGMFWVALALGLFQGAVYRYFITRTGYGALAQGFAVIFALGQTSVEGAMPKVLGGSISLLIVAGALWYFAIPTFAASIRARGTR